MDGKHGAGPGQDGQVAGKDSGRHPAAAQHLLRQQLHQTADARHNPRPEMGASPGRSRLPQGVLLSFASQQVLLMWKRQCYVEQWPCNAFMMNAAPAWSRLLQDLGDTTPLR